MGRLNDEPYSGLSGRMKTWFKKLGLLGFLFFLIKGLVWLALFWLGFEISGC